MREPIYTVNVDNLSALKDSDKQQSLSSLESGQVIYFPHYYFTLQANEQVVLSETVLDPKDKNISYDIQRQRIAGVAPNQLPTLSAVMKEFMNRFALYARELVDTLLPQYHQELIWGRTSYRPAEIKGRKRSKRQDDTRVHVDSFPATPVKGLRILRVFCNINPHGEPRVWHLGEHFTGVLAKFSSHIPPYSVTRAKLLKLVKATKSLRTPYDHYMLHLHDKMKLDDHYQEALVKHRFDFPPYSTWLVFTDHVSHAALSGQFLLEQTFYLPVTAMQNPEVSPLRQWEKQTSLALI